MRYIYTCMNRNIFIERDGYMSHVWIGSQGTSCMFDTQHVVNRKYKYQEKGCSLH